MKAAKSYLRWLTLFFVFTLNAITFISCDEKSVWDGIEFDSPTKLTSRAITINGDSYYQYGHGSFFLRSDYISCETDINEKGVYMPDYIITLRMSECIQGKNVELKKIDISKPDVIVFGTENCKLVSGQIVCKKRTSTEIELQFLNAKIQKKTDYLCNDGETASYYTVNGTLLYKCD